MLGKARGQTGMEESTGFGPEQDQQADMGPPWLQATACRLRQAVLGVQENSGHGLDECVSRIHK